MGLFDDDVTVIFGLPRQAPDSVPLRLLGLEELPAHRDVVLKAFRSKVMAAHPDLAAYTIPHVRELAEAAVATEGDVQELVWARDVLVRKLPLPQGSRRPKTPEERAYEAARKRHEPEQPKPRQPEPPTVTDDGARLPQRRRRARRPVTKGCVRCDKPFAPGDELWRFQYGAIQRRFCARCGESESRALPRWRSYPGTCMWRSRCAHCDRSIVLVHAGSWHPFSCSCEDPELLPMPGRGWNGELLGELRDKCAKCGFWAYRPADWWATYSCSPACTKALRRAGQRVEPEPRACEVCDEKYKPTRGDARYCSPACRQFAYRARKADR